MMMSFSSSNNIHNRFLLLVFFFFFTIGFIAVDAVEGGAADDDGADSTLLYKFTVQIDSTTVGSFNFHLMPEWAPLGAQRFQELVNSTDNFFSDVRFFRVLDGQIAQFGINGNTNISKYWRTNYIDDEVSVVASNRRGTISYAMAGVNTRTTQFFINLKYNLQYDSQGFAPIGYITTLEEEQEEEDDAVIDQLYSGYGDSPPRGLGPIQSKIHEEGNSYLINDFPLLSYIISVERTYEYEQEDEDIDITSGSRTTTTTTTTYYYGYYYGMILSISFVLCNCVFVIIQQLILILAS